MTFLLPCRPSLASTLVWSAVLAAAASVGCDRDRTAAPEPAAVKVRTVRPIERDVTDYAYFTGRTEALESVDVQARVTGYLDSVDFKPGADVKKGDHLFQIDPRPYQATLDEANGQVQLAEARLNLAKADYQRALEVSKTPGAISKQDVDHYAAAQEEAGAAVTAAKANCESAQLNRGFTTITSPIDGVVGRNLITVGNLVKQDQTLLTSVVSQDPIYVYFDVDERTMLRVERLIAKGQAPLPTEGPGPPVQLGLADEGNEYPHDGHIDFVNNQLNASTATLQVRGKFANPALKPGGPRLLSPGLFVRVRLPIGNPYKALLVPQAAVATDQGRRFLWVVGSDNTVEYRAVTLGPEQRDGLQVVFPVKLVRTKEGLREAVEGDKNTIDSVTASDRIVVGGLQRVHAGTRVEVQEEPAAEAATTTSPPGAESPKPTEEPAHKAPASSGK